MKKYVDVDGRTIPTWRVTLPAVVGGLVNMTIIGHYWFLSDQRPSQPDLANGYVIPIHIIGDVFHVPSST